MRYMYAKVIHLQLLDACGKRSIFDSGYRRHVVLYTLRGCNVDILDVECLYVLTVWTMDRL